MDRTRMGWWIIGAVLGGALAFVLSSFIGTVVAGIFLYYATRPVYRQVKRYVRRPSVAAFAALWLLELPLFLVLAYTVVVGIQDLGALLDQSQLLSDSTLQPYVDISATSGSLETALETADTESLRELLRSVVGYVSFVGIGLIHLFGTYVIAFYLLRDDHRLGSWVTQTFADAGGVVETFLVTVDEDLHHVFFGIILNAFLTGALGAVAYSLLSVVVSTNGGLPYPALLGLLAGAASLVPVVGTKLVYVPVTGYLVVVAAVDPDVTVALPVTFLLISFAVVDSIPDAILRPYVSGRNLHFGLMTLSYVLGTLAFGWYGILLGPILVVLAVHFGRLVVPELVAGEPIRPYAVDYAQTRLAGRPSGESPDAGPTAGED
jgi:predicted PurR-regulated permease PerM